MQIVLAVLKKKSVPTTTICRGIINPREREGSYLDKELGIHDDFPTFSCDLKRQKKSQNGTHEGDTSLSNSSVPNINVRIQERT